MYEIWRIDEQVETYIASYKTYKEALDKAKELIIETGHLQFFIKVGNN